MKSIATGVKLAYWSRFALVRNIGWSYLRELRCAHQLDPGASRLDGRRRGVLHAAGRRWLARYGRRAQLQRLESFFTAQWRSCACYGSSGSFAWFDLSPYSTKSADLRLPNHGREFLRFQSRSQPRPPPAVARLTQPWRVRSRPHHFCNHLLILQDFPRCGHFSQPFHLGFQLLHRSNIDFEAFVV